MFFLTAAIVQAVFAILSLAWDLVFKRRLAGTDYPSVQAKQEDKGFEAGEWCRTLFSSAAPLASIAVLLLVFVRQAEKKNWAQKFVPGLTNASIDFIGTVNK